MMSEGLRRPSKTELEFAALVRDIWAEAAREAQPKIACKVREMVQGSVAAIRGGEAPPYFHEEVENPVDGEQKNKMKDEIRAEQISQELTKWHAEAVRNAQPKIAHEYRKMLRSAASLFL